jgi:hypothetical protein
MVVTSEEPPREHRTRHPSRASELGQATVEFVALLPIIALLALAAGQGAVAGWTAWSASGAARVSARAEAVGQDPAQAARRALPRPLARGAKVTLGHAGGPTEHRTTVRLRIPAVVPGLRFGTVAVSAEIPNQDAAA